MISILIRSPCEDTQRDEGHVMTEAEIGVMQLKPRTANDCQQPPKLGDHGTDSASETPKNQTCWHFDFGPPVS